MTIFSDNPHDRRMERLMMTVPNFAPRGVGFRFTEAQVFITATAATPREASEMFQSIKYEDKREVFGFKIHSFSTLDRIKKYDDSDNGKSAEKPYSIEVGEIERTINLYAIATTKFQVAV